MEKKYDLVCFGTDRQGDERHIARRALAAMLSIEPDQADKLLDAHGTVLRRGIGEVEARVLMEKLARLGVRCNYRPASAGLGELSIVPIEEESGPTLIACPACGHKVTITDGVEPPEQCPACDIVYSKHQRIEDERAERERVKRRLVVAEQVKVEQESAEVARREQAERERKLEEEVRRELGLPKVLQGRHRIQGAALALFVVGAASGALLSQFVPGAQPQLADGAAGGAGAGAGARGPVAVPGAGGQLQLAQMRSHGPDPSMQMLAQLEADFPVDESLAGGAADDEFAGLAQSAGGAPLPGMPVGARTAGGHAASGGAPGHSATNGNAADSGTRLIENGAAGIGSLGQVALTTLKSSGAAAATPLLAEMSKRAEAMPHGLDRIKALSEVAHALRAAGDGPRGDEFFEAGVDEAGTLSGEADRALGFAAMAASAARSGDGDTANTLFLKANDVLRAVRVPEARLAALCELAETYRIAGRRAGALGLLDYVAASSESLTDAARRPSVLKALAVGYARAGAPGSGIDVADRISDQGQQQRALRDVALETIATGHSLWAKELVVRLSDPTDAASVYAALGRDQARASGTDQAAGAESFVQAEESIRKIADPVARIQASAELGQNYALANRGEAAAASFAQALQLVQKLDGAAQRDRAAAAVLDRQLGVLRTQDAQAIAGMLSDAALRTVAQQRITDADRLRGLLQPTRPAAVASS
ncbi:MAG: hypothetical protein U1E83_07660 [Methylotetracoccus sp.]